MVVKWCGECELWGDHLRVGNPTDGGAGTENIGEVEAAGDANVAESEVAGEMIVEDSDVGILSRLKATGLL